VLGLIVCLLWLCWTDVPRQLMDGMLDAESRVTTPEVQDTMVTPPLGEGRMLHATSDDGWASWTVPIEIRIHVPGQPALIGAASAPATDGTGRIFHFPYRHARCQRVSQHRP